MDSLLFIWKVETIVQKMRARTKSTSQNKIINTKREEKKKKKEKGYWKKEDNQREFMEKLFSKFGLKEKNDWLKINKQKIINEGGREVLKAHSFHYPSLLSFLYPSHSFDFSALKLHPNDLSFSSPSPNNISFPSPSPNYLSFPSPSPNNLSFPSPSPNYLSFPSSPNDLPFSSFSPPPNISLDNKRDVDINNNKEVDIKNNIMDKIMNNKVFDKEIGREDEIENEIEKERKEGRERGREGRRGRGYWREERNRKRFIEEISERMGLRSADDWMNRAKEVKRIIMRMRGGRYLLEHYFSFDLSLLLSSLFPPSIHPSISHSSNYPVDHSSSVDYSSNYSQSPVDCSVDNSPHSPRCSIDYSIDYSSLKKKKRGHWKREENQMALVESLYDKFNLRSLSDWEEVERVKIIEEGGYNLLVHHYANQLPRLLQTIYPNFPWRLFPSRSARDHRKISQLVAANKIRRKEEWFRLPFSSSLLPLLRRSFADHQWDEKLFQKKAKKVQQRNLFLSLSSLLPNKLLIENYRHPLLIADRNLEVDIFIPSLNMAIEYQGEYHYESGTISFTPAEIYQSRDLTKSSLASSLHLYLLSIPYWWSSSFPSSLFSSFSSFLFSSLKL